MRYLLKGFVCSADFSTLSRKAVLIENERITAIENDITGSCAADRVFEFKDEIISRASSMPTDTRIFQHWQHRSVSAK